MCQIKAWKLLFTNEKKSLNPSSNGRRLQHDERAQHVDYEFAT